MATNWRKKGKQAGFTTIAGRGVAQVVRLKRGYELRVYTSYQSAVAAGLVPKIARAHFKKVEGCDGICWTTFSEDNQWVWCIDEDCVDDACECDLFEMWKDEKGIHDENRGYPGKDWKYRRKTGRFYGCRCAPRPI